jgi:hypothetical protein
VSNARTTARTVGILFIASYIGVAVGAVLMAPALDSDTSLTTIHDEKAQLVIGTLFEFINDAAVIGIAVLLYPFLKRAGEGLALWYVGMRILEGGMFMIASAAVLSQLGLSDRAVDATSSDASRLEDLRSLSIDQNAGVGIMATVAFLAGAILLYTLLYRSRLVPRFIAVWGLVAVACVIAVNILAPDVTQASSAVLLLVVPMIANEFFLAIWFIAKGFTLEAASVSPSSPKKRA